MRSGPEAASHGDQDVAQYKYAYFLIRSPNTRFDHVYPAGGVAAHTGIYRCDGCGAEVAAKAREPLPAIDDHDHDSEGGGTRWRLTVAAQR